MSDPQLPPAALYIAGAWHTADETFPVHNPADGTLLAELPVARPEDLDHALAATAAGFVTWRRTQPWERSRVLRRIADGIRAQAERFALIMTLDQGKPLAQSMGEVLACADQFDWYADEARRVYGRTVEGRDAGTRIFVRREPVGPVAAFATWNFPALLGVRKIAPALAAGCSVVLMAPAEAPLCSLLVAELAHEAGLPAGVLNVVSGDGPMISRHLIGSDVIRKVSLTGSVPVGAELLRLAADGIKSVSMELGGHAPVLVFADADAERAGRMCARTKFRNAGQVCISPSRFLVHEDVAEAFTEAFVAQTREIRLGDGRDPATDMGPLTTARRLAGVHALVEDAVACGATVLTGGGPAGLPDGHFYLPTVLSGVRDDMKVMVEEPFGPVAPISTFRTFEEAVARANATPFGLAGFVFTEDLTTAFRASEELETGMVGVNEMTIATAEAPFGGVKQSGFGREGGTEGVQDYTVAKYVNLRLRSA
ncbi:succinate-semialdehyde dehydrogenase/glutarate-semialdehyde dehydrogenase [Nonomuraea thailandensis]|uniref:Succinate-semialdehyde dehydrogenase/glutarate-semialdehyde dehydrogenase n=1 Tax=Nonomuraea thailandensis TaxID=1188745 RepID=A0A9X2GIV3_9ACTN|nr:NAD-dependent succinate-semialdehyde dehydrogenase [Nonomuraea thailandensis]MCP2356206.1 succinate-semialdehyde dehydrogenase/glutarate-semialdehyde dehydrogenase [Nonomuraea thailandensis]